MTEYKSKTVLIERRYSMLHLRQLTSSDLPFADSLRATVGWNQTIQDWQRPLEIEPTGCFVAEWDGSPAGTATTTCYGPDLAWIGMVLVHPDFRRHGIGKALLNHCLDYLKKRGIRCVKLDATSLGKTLYDRLGFQDEWPLARWETAGLSMGHGPSSTVYDGQVRPLKNSDWDALLKLDTDIFGVSRAEILKKLAWNSLQVLALEERPGELRGYGMLRAGAKADYLGPVVSTWREGAASLIRALFSVSEKKSFLWDIPDQTDDACELAQQMGFIRQRPLIRMALGQNSHPGRPQHQYAIADPATG